eukprot:6035853-Pyramimonas_sp.AAC.1
MQCLYDDPTKGIQTTCLGPLPPSVNLGDGVLLGLVLSGCSGMTTTRDENGDVRYYMIHALARSPFPPIVQGLASATHVDKHGAALIVFGALLQIAAAECQEDHI